MAGEEFAGEDDGMMEDMDVDTDDKDSGGGAGDEPADDAAIELRTEFPETWLWVDTMTGYMQPW